VPWRSPILGQVRAGCPKNLTSGKAYRGINVFLLAFTAFARGFESAYWLTYKQTRERGGGVKKGEKGSLVVFWKPHEVVDKQTGEVKQTFLLRYYHVFNLDQCVDIKAPDAAVYTPSQFDPIEAAEQIVDGYDDGPQMMFGGGRAFYRPSIDTVTLPERERFASGEEFYSTMFHELAHSTGHSKRLDRGLDTDLQPFGSPDYGKEELIAEMTAAFLSGECGITPTVIQNQSSYISDGLASSRVTRCLCCHPPVLRNGRRIGFWEG